PAGGDLLVRQPEARAAACTLDDHVLLRAPRPAAPRDDAPRAGGTIRRSFAPAGPRSQFRAGLTRTFAPAIILPNLRASADADTDLADNDMNPAAGDVERPTRVIKRYTNRKLYDT